MKTKINHNLYNKKLKNIHTNTKKNNKYKISVKNDNFKINSQDLKISMLISTLKIKYSQPKITLLRKVHTKVFNRFYNHKK